MILFNSSLIVKYDRYKHTHNDRLLQVRKFDRGDVEGNNLCSFYHQSYIISFNDHKYKCSYFVE